MNMPGFNVAAFGILCLFVFVVKAEEKCTNVEQPEVINVEQQDGGITYKTTFGYPSDNVTVEYTCSHGNVRGNLYVSAQAVIKTNTSSSFSQKQLQYYPVPGLGNMTLSLSQSLPKFNLKALIQLDEEGFIITGLCYQQAGKESKQFKSDTTTPENFPFKLTDAGQLRFDLAKCNSTQNA